MGWRACVVADERARHATMARDVRAGLGRRPKTLPPKYFYDAVGSALFERITRLPEYYLTRAEHALLQRWAAEIMARSAPGEIVELGAGSPAKVRRLLAAANGGGPVRRYLPVDVAVEGIASAARDLERDYPDVEVHGIAGDFEHDLAHVPPARDRRLVAFLGSTLGNLEPVERTGLFGHIRRLLGAEDRVLLGVDLVKDRRALHAAYNDAEGVTAEFNRNILRVVNRGLGADFAPEAFRHHAYFNERASRIEMHLVPDQRQQVRVRDLDLDVEIEPQETVWTESSYKFTRDVVRDMLVAAGLALESWYTDGASTFALALAARA
jgi:L-histidine N-alpha-methyltransferase